MREILFRGLYENKNDDMEWKIGLLCLETGSSSFIHDINGDWLVDSKTIGQYTGLKDKNNKKIFEDDMIKGLDPGEFDVVVYSVNKFILSPQGDDCVYWEKCEIIGTIHDTDK